MDHFSAQSTWALARSYLAASDVLLSHGSGETRLPAIYLMCHALELGLKSFLLAHGLTMLALRSRKFGHDLVACLDEAEKRGLSQHWKVSRATRQDIVDLNAYYSSKQLEYFSGIEKQFPLPEDFRHAVDRALVGIFNPLTEVEFRAMSES